MSAALKLSRGIIAGNEDAVKRYLEFLKAGGSKDVLDILKDAGADLSTPEPIDEALAFFRETVDNLRSCLKEI
jgi:oligoendopeptidase F